MIYSIEQREWKEFKISDIFNISGTITTHPSKLKKGGTTPRITCAATNNGLDDLYNNEPTELGGVLTIDSATDGYVSYQGYDFIATDHVEKVELKEIKYMNRYLGLFLKKIIEQGASGKYGYGYKFSQKRIKKQTIILPVDESGEPDREYMEETMKKIEQKLLTNALQYFENKLQKPEMRGGGDLKYKQWGEFFVGDIFETRIGRNIDGNKIDKYGGIIPYITRKEVNNGVDGFIDGEKGLLNQEYPVVTIGNETAEPFVQVYPFFTGTKINILRSTIPCSHYALIFIAQSLKQHKSKYSYSFTINSTRLKKQKILLPIDDNYQPDYDFMDQYMKQIEHRKIKKYIERKIDSIKK